jgi:excinuclease ABC subunit A
VRERVLSVQGATEHNLRDLDVEIGPGLTAVVGVSGSGKSSLAFDTVYHEARRRFLETLSLGSFVARLKPAAVKSITGLGPAVSIAQNVLNRNPQSLVATAVGAHPFLRILFSRFSEVRCPGCGTKVRAMPHEERLREAGQLSGPVQVPLVRGVRGSHKRLLALVAAEFGRDAVSVDGRRWTGRALDASEPHDLTVVTGSLPAGARPARVREELDRADALGAHEVVIAGRTFLRSPICPGCGEWLPPLEPTAFRIGWPADTTSHTIRGRTIDEVLALRPSEALAFLGDAGIGATGTRIVDELRRRLEPLVALGLDHIALDRPMPTLSRGESQRVRLAVVLAGRLEDLLHVLDEPSIGLHRRDLDKLFHVLAGLPGPVLMVEHDATAIASADDVVEIGPDAGPGGGTLVFQGTPAALWRHDGVSGRYLSERVSAVTRAARPAGDEFIEIHRAFMRNLARVDCRFPAGRLTAVTGPSGAGKTTLVRDVLLASAEARAPVGCDGFEAGSLRVLAVDQSPIGNNPRSNPATYTKVFDGIRDIFAKATGASASTFTFNRKEGACEACEGVGMVELARRWTRSEWIVCESCEGRRFRADVLEMRVDDRSIADVLDLSVDAAREVFRGDRKVRGMLDALTQVGLGYISLGQPSPTLSGGEAQRVRLARQLVRTKPGDLVLLDEPTTGLHPADLGKLVSVLDGLTQAGCTVVVVEHQQDVVAAADWIIDLGPGGGPDGGRLMHCGPPAAAPPPVPAPRSEPRKRPRASDAIRIRGASANNLQNVSVDIPKRRFTAVTGVSGSGKSSLVRDVLEAEANRRLLECLSMYERQGLTEGPEAPVVSLDGIGPTIAIGAEPGSTSYQDTVNPATVGSASDLDRLLAIVLARGGRRECSECGGEMVRLSPKVDSRWACGACGAEEGAVEVRHLVRHTSVEAGCARCYGRGIVREAVVDRIVVHADKPLLRGCLGPGPWKLDFDTPGTEGYQKMRVLMERYGFDPRKTPWDEMSKDAQHAFLYGDPDPMHVTGWKAAEYEAVKAGAAFDATPWHERAPDTAREVRWHGIVRSVEIWDRGGYVTTGKACPRCNGKRLKPGYLTIRLDGHDANELSTMPLHSLAGVLARTRLKPDDLAARSVATARERLEFLCEVGLGYLHLHRIASTLAAGEAQRVKLASLLGSGLLAMTVLLDEPSRGLHPREVEVLARALVRLRDAGNTVVAVEHDGVFLSHADHIVEIGPGAGARGGRLAYAGPREDAPAGATADAIRGVPSAVVRERRTPTAWMQIRGATANNLRIDSLSLPLGALTGVCGVSGSGKSTLVVDTLGLALAPQKDFRFITTERMYEPGEHEAITGAPGRTIVADQTRAGISSPGVLLGLTAALRKAFGSSDQAVAAGLDERDFAFGCDACTNGYVVEAMGFLPAVSSLCDVCDGTGYRAETRAIVERGRTLPEIEGRTIEDLAQEWGDVAAVGRATDVAMRLGLGYLVVRQEAWTLSGGEAQRLKLGHELAKKTAQPTLYLLDEPTLGLHVRDVGALAKALHEVVAAGNTVIVVEHDPNLLASCDWVVELGPGAGPDGGRVVAEGTPEAVARLDTPTSPYLRKVLR